MLAAAVLVLTGVLSATAGTVRVEPSSPRAGEAFRVVAEPAEGERLNCTLTLVTPTAMESLSCRAPSGVAGAPGSYKVVARFSSPGGDTQAEALFAVAAGASAENPGPAPAAATAPGTLVRVPSGERVSAPLPKRPRIQRRRRRPRPTPPPLPQVGLEVLGTPLVGNTLSLSLQGDLAEDAPIALVVQAPSGKRSLQGPGPFQVALPEPGTWNFLVVQGNDSLDQASVVVPDPALLLHVPETVPLGDSATITAKVENASPLVDWSYSVVLSAPGGEQTVLNQSGGGWTFSVTDAGPWTVAVVASAPGGLIELAAREVTGGDLSIAASPPSPTVGTSGLVEVLQGSSAGQLQLLVTSPEGSTEALEGPGPWNVEWTVAGRWTLSLRSTHEAETREARLGVTVEPEAQAAAAETPTPPSPPAPNPPVLAGPAEPPPGGADAPPSPADAPPGLADAPAEDPTEMQAPEGTSPLDAVLALLTAAAVGLAVVFLRLWQKQTATHPLVDIQGVQIARGPTRAQSTGAGLRSLRVSLVMERGPTRVSLRPDSAPEAS